MNNVIKCLVLFSIAGACSSKSSPPPEKEPAKTVEAPAVSASASGTAERAAKKTLPTLIAEPPKLEGVIPSQVYAIEGAFIVVEGLRIGRLVGEKVEWIGKVDDAREAYGGSRIASVQGRYPDAVDVLYTSNNGRALMPTFLPLTGKGESYTAGPGGSLGSIVGLARAGESLVLAADEGTNGHAIATVRGPRLRIKPQSPAQAGCKDGEADPYGTDDARRGLPPRAFGATPKGTILAIGNLCSKRGAAAEVWDMPGKSRIVDLSSMVKNLDYHPTILPGQGDEVFVFASERDPILHYKDGNFEALPRLEEPIVDAFVSTHKQIHALAGTVIHRFQDGQWVPVSQIPWRVKYVHFSMDESDALWSTSLRGVFRLREGRGVAYEDGCKTPFVYLYDVARENAPDFTFPSTQKVLASFAGVSEIGLVEFDEGGRRLGLMVTSKEQGEAVLAHVKANMKDEYPKLLCYEPTKPRKIEIKPQK